MTSSCLTISVLISLALATSGGALASDRGAPAASRHSVVARSRPVPQLKAQTPQLDNRPYPFELSAEQLSDEALSGDDLSKLAGHRVVLLVDRSDSMNKQDCPGGASRWEWCRQQAFKLATQLNAVSCDGLCVVPFNTKFAIYDHQSPEQISQLFANTHPFGSTKLAPALRSQLITQLVRQWGGSKPQPLLITVITDGQLKDAAAVHQTICETTARMRPDNQVKILFLNVGSQNMVAFDTLDLPKPGLVETLSFDEVTRMGLTMRLAQSVRF